MAIFSEYHSIPGLAASAALTQYKIVQIASTAGQCKLGTSGTSKILGVLQNDPDAAGQPADVAFLGVCKALAEASVAYGDMVTCSSTGRAKTVADGETVLGRSLTGTTTSAGDIITVLLSGIALNATA